MNQNQNNTAPVDEPKPTIEPEPGHKWIRTLMYHKWIQIPIDTPVCCDPSTETYWSM